MTTLSSPFVRVGDEAPWLFQGVDLKFFRPSAAKSADHRVFPPSVVAAGAGVLVLGAAVVVCGAAAAAVWGAAVAVVRAAGSERPAGATATSGRAISPVSVRGSARDDGPVLAAATLAPVSAPNSASAPTARVGDTNRVSRGARCEA